MKAYMESGGSILITLGEGGETRYDTNVNFFLEDYGIAVCNGEAPCQPCVLDPTCSKSYVAGCHRVANRQHTDTQHLRVGKSPVRFDMTSCDCTGHWCYLARD